MPSFQHVSTGLNCGTDLTRSWTTLANNGAVPRVSLHVFGSPFGTLYVTNFRWYRNVCGQHFHTLSDELIPHITTPCLFQYIVYPCLIQFMYSIYIYIYIHISLQMSGASAKSVWHVHTFFFFCDEFIPQKHVSNCRTRSWFQLIWSLDISYIRVFIYNVSFFHFFNIYINILIYIYIYYYHYYYYYYYYILLLLLYDYKYVMSVPFSTSPIFSRTTLQGEASRLTEDSHELFSEESKTVGTGCWNTTYPFVCCCQSLFCWLYVLKNP